MRRAVPDSFHRNEFERGRFGRVCDYWCHTNRRYEREKPIGHDNGFMWALNSYWRLEEKDGGVYIQCEAITLTRDIPMLLSAIRIQPQW